MEFHVHVAGKALDLDALEARLLAVDPAAVLDLDSAATTLRISTLAQAQDLAEALAAAGQPVALHDIEQQPSVCCGGCGG
ncbi:hypothetical protein [Pseudoxanthomonas koreensis]|uniref:hypothetical protein n=1 Tax=Pseudoxanthomonas koreensis TaxID=266061 RepID=UPI0013909D79|nr:hypothetical protein [Pseudoxanthomonas koreensis]KAF1693131.1 hypothetical protein CSC64_06255 [Pseudoxanthomonas koreensis]